MSKKLMLATTALTLAFAGASHAKFDVKVGGDYKNGISYVSAESDTNGTEEFQSYQDFEFKIQSSMEMDNGITAFFKIEFDAQTNDEGQFDDIETGFKGNFGMVRFGNFNSDDVIYSTMPTETAIFSNLGFNTSYTGKFSSTGLPSVGLNIGGGDVNAIMYVSPSVAGFTGAARYTFSDSQVSNSAGVNEANEFQNQQVALGYKGEFGGVKVALGGMYANETEGDGGEEITASAKVEMNGAGLTFMYADYEQEDATNGDTEIQSYSINPFYKTGPWKITGAYAVQDTDGGDKISGYGLGASYAMGPGVTLGVELQSAELDPQTGDTSNDTVATAGFIFKF